MRTIVLIACGARKRATPCKAKDLYQGPLFRAARRAAERTGHEWAILSALHGVVIPEQLLSPYEKALPASPKAEREAWCQRTGETIRRKWPGCSFICFASSHYAGALAGLPAQFPMRGLPIGKQLQKLKRYV